LVPTRDLGDDTVGVGAPDEGLGALVVLVQRAVDRGLEVDQRGKAPRCRRRRVRLAKKVSIALSQEQEVGVKWKVQRG
jgi:hypothetical protein